jgi:hypothetical protein
MAVLKILFIVVSFVRSVATGRGTVRFHARITRRNWLNGG